MPGLPAWAGAMASTRDATRTEHEDAAAADAPVWGVTVVASPDTEIVGRSFRVDQGLCVGRSAGDGVDLAVRDDRLSRRHLGFRRRGAVYEVVDHDSKNGTRIAGERIEVAALVEGEVVRAGSTFFVFERIVVDEDDVRVGDDEILGRSSALVKMLAEVDRLAALDVAVLLIGETGTGKELVARRIHRCSRRPGPLVALNCAAIPAELAESVLFGHVKGAFTGAVEAAAGTLAAADTGTLFLDELGELPLPLQPKLLRALETWTFMPVGGARERRADVRVIAATVVDLRAAITDGRFRPDLYARLAAAVVRLPPLRERKLDIPFLLHHFLGVAGAAAVEITPPLLEVLLRHPWTMNVRELRAVAGHLARTGVQALGVEHLPADFVPTRDPAAPVASGRPDREALLAALARHGGNVAEVARELDRDRKQIYRWLRQHGIDPRATED